MTTYICTTCQDTGLVESPDPGGESVYESACPEPVHDGEDSQWVSRGRGNYLGVDAALDDEEPF